MKTMSVFKLFSLTLFVTSLMSGVVANAGVFEDLSPEDQALINKGEQVLKTVDVAGSAWPSITVLQRIEANSDEVAAVMFDYPLHTTMFEGIIKSIPATPGAAATDIEYEMVFPKVMGISLPNEKYTVNDVLSSSAPDAFEISWTMVKASSMKNTTGSVKFEKLGTGMIVSYTSFISPPRPAMAKLIVGMAKDRVKGSVKALEKQVLLERNASPRTQLDAQLAALNKALGR